MIEVILLVLYEGPIVQLGIKPLDPAAYFDKLSNTKRHISQFIIKKIK